MEYILQGNRVAWVSDGIGTSKTRERLEFCFPVNGFKPTVKFPAKGIDCDVTVLNLRKDFEQADKENPEIYAGDYNKFLEAVRMFVPGKIEENGIYTNITYPKWVHFYHNLLLGTK